MSDNVLDPVPYNSPSRTNVNSNLLASQQSSDSTGTTSCESTLPESGDNHLINANSKTTRGEKPQRKDNEDSSNENSTSMYFPNHSSNSSNGYAEGPLTTSLSASGEIESDAQGNSEASEEALLNQHSGLPRASVPGIKSNSDISNKLTHEGKYRADYPNTRRDRDLSHANSEADRPSISRTSSGSVKDKAASEVNGQVSSVSDQWDNRPPLEPMEPIKIAKVNPSWNSNRGKTHSFDLSPSARSNKELPHIPGFPTGDPGLTNPINVHSVPSISEDTRLASIIKGQEYTGPHDSRSRINGGLHSYNDNKMSELPSNILNDTYMQPASAPPLVLVNPNSQPNIGGYKHSSQTAGSVYSFNEYSPSLTPVSQAQPSVKDHGEISDNYMSQNADIGYKNVGLSAIGARSSTPSYRPSFVSMNPVPNGGTLSFITQHPQQQITSTYPALPNHVPTNTVQTPPLSLAPLGISIEQIPSVELRQSPGRQQHKTPHRPTLDSAHTGFIAPHPNVPSKDNTATFHNNGSSKHNQDIIYEQGREFSARSSLPNNSPDRIYKCTHPGCDWSFARSSDQKRHIRSHQKPNLRCPYWELEPNCSRKGAMFYRLDVLKRHLRLVHLNRVTDSPTGGGVCRICSNHFNTSRDFLDHCDSCAQTALAQKKKQNGT